jgi:hypothetical protein
MEAALAFLGMIDPEVLAIIAVTPVADDGRRGIPLYSRCGA